MDTKILFTDLDGTLLNRKKEITAENDAAIDRALTAGHKVVINTGRPLCGCMAQIRELGLEREGCYAITYNGGLIYDCYTKKTLYKKGIPLAYVRHIFSETQRRGIYCQTYSDESLLTLCDTEELQYYTSRTHTPYQIDPDLLSHLTEAPVKLLAIDLKLGREVLDLYRQEMADWAEGKVSIFYSSQFYLEHVAYGISKGAAIQILCDHLNIPLSNTIAAGDEENDIDMIRKAKIGVAMSNAIPVVKECADYITVHDCDHSGIAEVIKHFMDC